MLWRGAPQAQLSIGARYFVVRFCMYILYFFVLVTVSKDSLMPGRGATKNHINLKKIRTFQILKKSRERETGRQRGRERRGHTITPQHSFIPSPQYFLLFARIWVTRGAKGSIKGRVNQMLRKKLFGQCCSITHVYLYK